MIRYRPLYAGPRESGRETQMQDIGISIEGREAFGPKALTSRCARYECQRSRAEVDSLLIIYRLSPGTYLGRSLKFARLAEPTDQHNGRPWRKSEDGW